MKLQNKRAQRLKYTAEFIQTANGVLLSGYVRGGVERGDSKGEFAREFNIPISEQSET